MDSTHPKKVIILVPSLQAGGQERVAVNTANILNDRYTVTVVVFNSRDAAYSTDCQFISLNLPAASGIWKKALNALRRKQALKRLKKELGADITISFGMTANLVNILSRGTGKTITRISSYGEISEKLLHRFIYGRSDQIICSTKAMEQRLVEIFPNCKRRSNVIPNPFDIQSLLERSQIPVDDYVFSPHTLVSLGRLDKVKNYPRLIKAFSLVKQEISDAQLLIIGDGPLRNKLQSLAVQHGLEKSVTLLGFRQNPFAYLEKSSVYVLSSFMEGFPNALVEGMAFLPAVAVDCLSGPREILGGNTLDASTSPVEIADYGILVANSKEAEYDAAINEADHLLAKGILTILADPEKLSAMKKKARIRAESFSYKSYRTALEQIIEELSPF